jgi:micrococcal nuclease
MMGKILFYIVIFSLPAISCNSKSGKRNDSDKHFLVSKVVDGDTFWIDNGSEKGEKIRLIGVDAPESRKTGRKEIGYFGKEAKEYLTKLILGKMIKLEFDVGHKDMYGRTLAYVYLDGGVFVNADLVKQGYAMVMTIPPNVKFAELFVKLQQEARDNRRGLWNN